MAVENAGCAIDVAQSHALVVHPQNGQSHRLAQFRRLDT